MININKVFAETKLKLESNTMEEKLFPFSKTNKNVVVFMLDRAISTFFPYILKEKPELQEQFRGFTYYPNTISFGGTTNVGTPSLFGGYEYTPEELNKRNTELLKDKQNEALSVLPVLFDRNNFETVVCDPPYAGYTWIPDLSIYDDYPDIKSYITIGSFGSSVDDVLGVLNRNLFSYSISKIVPSIFFNIVYNNGTYLSAKDVINSDKKIDISVLMDNYRVLEKLPELTSTTDEGTG